MSTEDQRRKWREYMREYNRHNAEKNRAKVKKWREENPEKFKAQRKRECEYMKARRKENPEPFRQRDRKCDLKRHYQMTVEEYDRRYQEQQGVCAICKQPEPTGRRLAVDHDHHCCAGKNSCGRCIRGLLCSICNHALERFDVVDNFATLVLAYLEGYKCPRQS
jgi:Recombination endonuclease VII